jgi:transposase-like protein
MIYNLSHDFSIPFAQVTSNGAMLQAEFWRFFPDTLEEFERRFADENACYEFLFDVRWSRGPQCSHCHAQTGWMTARGLFHCRRCNHQTSLTAGTPLHGTRKPLNRWFRAIWELQRNPNGIRAKDLQSIMNFGSYKTAWSWLRKLRSSLVIPARASNQKPIEMHARSLGQHLSSFSRVPSRRERMRLLRKIKQSDSHLRKSPAPHANRVVKVFDNVN